MTTESPNNAFRITKVAIASVALLVAVIAFVANPDFTSLGGLVVVIGGVVVLYTRKTSRRVDILAAIVLVALTLAGVRLVFLRTGCLDIKRGILNCEIDVERAVQMIYGEKTKIDENGVLQTENGALVGVIMATSYVENGVQKYILLTQRSEPFETCHSCGAYIDGAVFTSIQDAWHLDVAQQEITRAGYFGMAPEGSLKEIGPNKYGYLFYARYGSTGLNLKSAILITQIGEGFKEVLNELVSMDNADGCQPDFPFECWGYNGSIELIQGEDALYYDIRIHRRGTDGLEKEAPEPLDEATVYRFSHGEDKYLPIQE